MFTLAAQLTLTDLFKFWFNNIWFPVTHWIAGTFGVSEGLASLIFLIFIIGLAGAVNDNRKKNLIKQAIKETQPKIKIFSFEEDRVELAIQDYKAQKNVEVLPFE